MVGEMEGWEKKTVIKGGVPSFDARGFRSRWTRVSSAAKQFLGRTWKLAFAAAVCGEGLGRVGLGRAIKKIAAGLRSVWSNVALP